MILRIHLLVVPTAMAAGLLEIGRLESGLTGMLVYGAIATVAMLVLRLTSTTALVVHLRHGKKLEPTPAIVRNLATSARMRPPTVYVIPGRRIFTTSWLHRRPIVFVGEHWHRDGDLSRDVVGALAHELAHVWRRDFLWKQLAQMLTTFAVSLMLVSPLGAFVPSVLSGFSLPELFVVICIPFVSWLAATQYPMLMRRLELRADRSALRWCGAERLRRSIRTLVDDSRAWIFSSHPSAAERLARIREVAGYE